MAALTFPTPLADRAFDLHVEHLRSHGGGLCAHVAVAVAFDAFAAGEQLDVQTGFLTSPASGRVVAHAWNVTSDGLALDVPHEHFMPLDEYLAASKASHLTRFTRRDVKLALRKYPDFGEAAQRYFWRRSHPAVLQHVTGN